MSDSKKNGIVQFIKFALVGGSNVAVSYIAYILVLLISDNLFVANFVAYTAGTINSFIWNDLWVFRRADGEDRNPWLAFIKLYITYAVTGIVLNYLLLLLWIDVLGISKSIAPIINSILGIPINFFISKFWCFKAKRMEGAEQ